MVDKEKLREAVVETIKEVGLPAFKRTSLFMSSRAALNEQVSG